MSLVARCSWRARHGLVAGGVALVLSLVGGTGHASGDVDLGSFMAPNLGSQLGDWQSGWRDHYKRPNLRVRVTSDDQPGDGLVLSSLTQLQIGDVDARSSVEGMTLYVLPGAGLGGNPIVTGSATAIGNVSDITVCMSGSCSDDPDVPDGGVEEPAGDVDVPGGDKPKIVVISEVDGSGTGGATVTILDTTGSESTEETGTGESVGAAQEDDEGAETAESGLNFEIAMAPNLGIRPGSDDWLLHDIGDWLVEIDPSVYLLNRVLVVRSQLMVGDVTASSTAEDIEVVVPEAEVAVAEAVEDGEVAEELPAIVLNATAIGNVASISSDVGAVVMDRQITIGSSDGEIKLPEGLGGGEPEAKTMSEALLTMMAVDGLEKAEISAEASAENFAGALSELNATALANVHSVSGNPGVEIGSFLGVNLVQLSYADISAISDKGPADITGNLEFSSVATAIGNVATISVPHPFN